MRERFMGDERGCSYCLKVVFTPTGCMHVLQVLLCFLALVCAGASHATLAGFSSGITSTGFGMNGGGSVFEGNDLQRVQELDRAFNMQRAPALYGAIGVTLGLGMITLGVLVGSASASGTSCLFIAFEILFTVVAAAGCLVGIAYYLIHVLRVNASEVCAEREKLYRNHGHTWMTCDVADVAVAIFGSILAIVYLASTVLFFLALIKLMRQKQKREARSKKHSHPKAKDLIVKEHVWHSKKDKRDLARHRERDTRDPARHGERDTRDPARHGERDTRDPARHGERDTRDPARHGQMDTRDPERHGQRDSRDPEKERESRERKRHRDAVKKDNPTKTTQNVIVTDKTWFADI
uniref:MARVEL domain-containing protein 3-like isoform X2 n=1 Tax=Myxine glutinosa TaxID=7769 RepID=UPI00358EC003